MRAFSVVVFVLATIASEPEQPHVFDGPLIESVYGPLKPVERLLPWSARSPSLKSSDMVRGVRTPTKCIFPLDVVIVQDATASFADDFENMRDNQVQAMFKSLRMTHPGSRFGVMSFRDKPVGALGRSTDYCERLELPLTNDTRAVEAVYARMKSTGGGDFPENQFGAIFAAAHSTQLNWSSRSSISTRLIVLATDAPPHYSDDGLNLYGMGPFTGLYNESSASRQCVEEYYPSPEHVKQALWARQAYLAQIVFDSLGQNGIVGRSWKWFNQFIGQTPDFVEPMLDDASNFWQALGAVIEQIEDVECQNIFSTSTTTSQATSTPTTQETPSTTGAQSSSTLTSTTNEVTTATNGAQSSSTLTSTTNEVTTATNGAESSSTLTSTTNEVTTATTAASATTEGVRSDSMLSTTSASTTSATSTNEGATSADVGSSNGSDSSEEVNTTEGLPTECPTATTGECPTAIPQDCSTTPSTECPTLPEAECETTGCAKQDEVVIRLLRRPARMHLDFDDNVTSF